MLSGPKKILSEVFVSAWTPENLLAPVAAIDLLAQARCVYALSAADLSSVRATPEGAN
jgi:hypothetical protein